MNPADRFSSGSEPETHPVCNPVDSAEPGEAAPAAETDNDETRIVQRGTGRMRNNEAEHNDDTVLVQRVKYDHTRVVVRREQGRPAESLDDTQLSLRRATPPLRKALDDVPQRRYEPPHVRSGQSARYPARQAPTVAQPTIAQPIAVQPASLTERSKADNNSVRVIPTSMTPEIGARATFAVGRRCRVRLITLLSVGVVLVAVIVFQTILPG